MQSLEGKHYFIAGVADDQGFGWAIAKHLLQRGAQVSIGVWPPALSLFKKQLDAGKFSEPLSFAHILPFDGLYDQYDAIPNDVRDNRRYAPYGDCSINAAANFFTTHPIDGFIHAIANAPEIQASLLTTTRQGFLRAIDASTYSFIAMVQKLGPLCPNGHALTLTFQASQRVYPGYGGGMGAAKAALEQSVRELSYDAGRAWGLHVNALSPGPWESRAARAIGPIQTMIENCKRQAPLHRAISADDVGCAAAALMGCRNITGTIIPVDAGVHAMS